MSQHRPTLWITSVCSLPAIGCFHLNWTASDMKAGLLSSLSTAVPPVHRRYLCLLSELIPRNLNIYSPDLSLSLAWRSAISSSSLSRASFNSKSCVMYPGGFTWWRRQTCRQTTVHITQGVQKDQSSFIPQSLWVWPWAKGLWHHHLSRKNHIKYLLFVPTNLSLWFAAGVSKLLHLSGQIWPTTSFCK